MKKIVFFYDAGANSTSSILNFSDNVTEAELDTYVADGASRWGSHFGSEQNASGHWEVFDPIKHSEIN